MRVHFSYYEEIKDLSYKVVLCGAAIRYFSVFTAVVLVMANQSTPVRSQVCCSHSLHIEHPKQHSTSNNAQLRHFGQTSIRQVPNPQVMATTPAIQPTTPPLPHPRQFHLLSQLPIELRLKIWHSSFEPRIVEVHGRRAHYADDFKHGSVPKWQSGCNNPAALSVNSEARAAALAYYCIRLPLATVASCERAGDSVADLYRVLYINPTFDTVVILGDLDYYRLSLLLSDIRHRDPAGEGLRRLAVSARWTYHQGAGTSIRVLVQNLFPELVQMIVYMYDEKLPPVDWANGVCELDDCSDKDYYKRYAMGRGQEMRDGDRWIVIGKKELRVMDLNFRHGW